jgi:hypothetical protein
MRKRTAGGGRRTRRGATAKIAASAGCIGMRYSKLLCACCCCMLLLLLRVRLCARCGSCWKKGSPVQWMRRQQSKRIGRAVERTSI